MHPANRTAARPSVRVLVSDPLLFAALAVAAQRVQNSRVAQGFSTGEIEYDIREDRVALRRPGGTEFMVFALVERS